MGDWQENLGEGLSGKRIAFVLFGEIDLDPRLLKSVVALADAGGNITVIAPQDRNARITLLDPRAHTVLIAPMTIKWPVPSQNSHRSLRVLWNLLIHGPIHFVFRLLSPPEFKIFERELKTGNYDLVWFINYYTSELQVAYQKSAQGPTIYETYEFFPAFFLGRFQGFESVSQEAIDRVMGAEKAAMQQAVTSICVNEQIAERYSVLYNAEKPKVVYNVPFDGPLPPREGEGALRFYSQSNLCPDYGLEEILEAFSYVKGAYRLTFQGREHVPGFLQKMKEMARSYGIERSVEFKEPCTVDQVVSEANKYDVGLSAFPFEFDGKVMENNYYALPNRFFVYSNAGLAQCCRRYPAIVDLAGDIDMFQWFDGGAAEMAAALQELIDDPARVRELKQHSFEWAQTCNFGTEAEKIKIIAAQAMM